MAQAVQMCWDAMPEPKILVAVGACAISPGGGVFTDSPALDRRFWSRWRQPCMFLAALHIR